MICCICNLSQDICGPFWRVRVKSAILLVKHFAQIIARLTAVSPQRGAATATAAAWVLLPLLCLLSSRHHHPRCVTPSSNHMTANLIHINTAPLATINTRVAHMN